MPPHFHELPIFPPPQLLLTLNRHQCAHGIPKVMPELFTNSIVGSLKSVICLMSPKNLSFVVPKNSYNYLIGGASLNHADT